MAKACSCVAAFVGWYNDQHRHSGIRFLTPSERHSGKAIEICRNRARVYELARQGHPLRWSGTTRCWHQPEVVWINPLPPENEAKPATFVMAACSAAGKSSFLAVTALDCGASFIFFRKYRGKSQLSYSGCSDQATAKITRCQMSSLHVLLEYLPAYF